MSRYKDEQCRICRREGQKLFLKGSRCYTDKCSVTRRNYAPGEHGQGKKKLSEYGTQLREKQKTKSFYGVGEKQFRKYFEMAENKKGITGENLLQILESRLDNVVYRAGFGSSRAQARQLVNHGHFDVNGKKVDIPSYLIKEGDIISVREIKQDNKTLKENVEANKARPIPEATPNADITAAFLNCFLEFLSTLSCCSLFSVSLCDLSKLAILLKLLFLKAFNVNKFLAKLNVYSATGIALQAKTIPAFVEIARFFTSSLIAVFDVICSTVFGICSFTLSFIAEGIKFLKILFLNNFSPNIGEAK